MFDFFKKKSKEIDVTKDPLWIVTVIPDEVAKVTVLDYDEKQALATFLKLNGFSPADVEEMLNSKFPFDKAWKQYVIPRDSYYSEMIRQLNQMKLLVMERLKNNEQREAFIVSCVEYFRLFAGRMIGVSYPKCKKEDYYDLEGFVKKLNDNDFEWVKKGLDKDVFNCVAFYSQKFNVTYKKIMSEIINQISHNANIVGYQYESIGGVDLFIDIVSKLLELSFKNMRFSLKSVVPVEESKPKTEENSSDEDFFDFTNMQSIYEGIKKQYIIQDDNMKIAEKEISKALRIIDFLKEERKIPESVNFDIKNIVYAMQYTMDKNNIQFYTFLRYTPLTSTGKVAKNMCTLNFDINEEPCEFLNEGLYTVDDYMDSEKHRGLDGVIKYNKDKQITEITMFFYKDDISYHIKTKTDKVKKLEDIEFKAERIG